MYKKLPKYVIRGSYYELGLQQGLYLKNKYKRWLRNCYYWLWKQYTQSAKGVYELAYALECEKLLKKFYPGILDEVKGFAKGIDTDYKRPLTFLFKSNFNQFSIGGCTVLSVNCEKGQNNNVLVGRNYDWKPIAKKAWKIYSTYPTTAYAHIGCTVLFFGRYDGLNEHGLCVALAALPNIKVTSRQIGFPSWLVLRIILDSCKNTEEAKNFLEKIPIAGDRGMAFLIADKSGKMSVAEIMPGKIKVRESLNGHNKYIIATNHSITEEFQVCEKSININSINRYNKIKKILENTEYKIDIDFIQRVLSNHEAKICKHDRNKVTIWSNIYDCNGLNALVAPGNPCKVKYQSLTF